MATLLIKFTNEGQYDPSTSTITYEDGLPSRWSSVYSKLKTGDTGIFHSDSNMLYIGEYQSSITNTSVTFGNVRKTSIKLDDFLRIHLLQPETISVFKRPPGPILKDDIDVNQLFKEASNRKFISFYAIRKGKESLYLPKLSENDRVVLIDDSEKITDLCIVENGALDSKIMGADLFQAKGKNLQEILNIHKSIQNERGLKSSNNVKSIERLIDNLAKVGFYQFKSFSEYYNAIHNKSAYNPQSLAGPDGYDTKSSDDSFLEEEIDVKYSLNSILYGPPGTGKTYFTKNLAIQIIENKSEEEIKLAYPDREDLNRAFLKYQKEEQIGFVTFHQSFGYEDFIEGIKPDLEKRLSPDTGVEDEREAQSAITYKIEDGIFKKMAERADSYQTFAEESGKFSFDKKQLQGLENKQFFKMSLGNTADEDDDAIYKYCINNNCIALGWGQDIDFSKVSDEAQIKTLFKENGEAESKYEIFAVKCFKHWMQEGDIVFISDGNLKARAIGLIDGPYHYDKDSPIRYNHFRDVKWLIKDANIPVDQIYGKKFSQQTIYAMFTHLVKVDFFRKSEPVSSKKQNHVLIIDEINRGNISSIFGELITLIEPDKRKSTGENEYFPVTLPYSKKPFLVPSNLYIIGTMNTADRSVEALDTALRRRFSFVKMEPKPDELPIKMIGNIDLVLMLKTINKRLEVLIDTDHTIGHAWLWDVDSLGGLKKAFKDKIIPLLQEFFYNDYEKIGLILGKDFVKQKPAKEYVHFAPFKGDSDLASSYHEKTIFTLAEMDEEIAEASFLGIYTQKTDESK
jgi:hypothetical protein